MEFKIGQFVYDKVLEVYGLVIYDKSDEKYKLFLGSEKVKKGKGFLFDFVDLSVENLIDIVDLNRKTYSIYATLIKEVSPYFLEISRTDWKKESLKQFHIKSLEYQNKIYNSIKDKYIEVKKLEVNKSYIVVYKYMINHRKYFSFALIEYFGEKLFILPDNYYRVSSKPRKQIIVDELNYDIDKIKEYYHSLPYFDENHVFLNLYTYISLEPFIRCDVDFDECAQSSHPIHKDVDIYNDLLLNSPINKLADSIELYEYTKELSEVPSEMKLQEFYDGKNWISVDVKAIDGDVPLIQIL